MAGEHIPPGEYLFCPRNASNDHCGIFNNVWVPCRVTVSGEVLVKRKEDLLLFPLTMIPTNPEDYSVWGSGWAYELQCFKPLCDEGNSSEEL